MPSVWWPQTQPEPSTHLHHNPQILDVVFLCLYQLIQDKPEEEMNNVGTSSQRSKTSSHSSSRESYSGTVMTRPPKAGLPLAPVGKVLTGALSTRAPTELLRAPRPRGPSQAAHNSQNVAEPSILLSIHYASSSLTYNWAVVWTQGRKMDNQFGKTELWKLWGQGRLFFLHFSSLLPFTRGERHLFDNHPLRPQTSSEAFEIQKLQLFR